VFDVYYEIIVLKNGKHLFATAERSLRSEGEAREVYNIMKGKFTAEEGYTLKVGCYSLRGEDIEFEEEKSDEKVKAITFGGLSKDDSWKRAVIVFTKDSFTTEYTEEERSYYVSRESKYFNPNMNGNSLFGNCLDGKDNGVRLDNYMSGKDGWKVERCYIVE
jgi:hypothetical protein